MDHKRSDTIFTIKEHEDYDTKIKNKEDFEYNLAPST